MRRLLILAASVLLLASACNDEEGADTTGTVESEPVTTGASTGDPAGEPTTSAPESSPTEPVSVPPLGEVQLTELARLESLSALAPHPETGALFVAQRGGLVTVVDPETGEAGEPALDMSERTVAEGERGLLGIAIAPDATFVYLYYTDTDGDSVLDEYPLDGATIDGSGRREVLTLDQPFPNHNGGQLAFGPDGFLYLGLGDGGSAGDPLGAGQDTGTLLGKILRLDPTGADPYAVPDDNPFVDGGGEPEVWLYGVRNPWRFSFDRGTGDLWVADVGQNLYEEIDRLPADDEGTAGRGANLGWNLMEGFEPFEGGTEPADHTPPVFAYGRDDGCSVTGGYVYRGEAIPFLEGVYVFGDYCTSDLWGLRIDGSGTVTERLDLGVDLGQNELVSFGEGLDGELYALAGSGTLYRLDAV
jgi:glucose/arabinose dehydrogenase